MRTFQTQQFWWELYFDNFQEICPFNLHNHPDGQENTVCGQKGSKKILIRPSLDKNAFPNI